MSSTSHNWFDGLERLGLGQRERALFAEFVERGLEPARVARVDRGMPLVVTARGVERAEPAMHLLKSSSHVESRAVVGDWVALARLRGHDLLLIEAILPRKSEFSRKDPGEDTGKQVLLANVDTVFVVQSLSGSGLNARRLERELVLAWESGATPVALLTKADLCDDVESQRRLARSVAFGVDVIVESAVTGEGVDEVLARIPAGETAAFLGGSGVGKSTLVNRLAGLEIQRTRAVRAIDDKGRHTTVAREMTEIPGHGVVIDTPGMRALALWDAEEGLHSAFPEIEALSERCRFRDCAHDEEPGCAVRAAVEQGELPARRRESYLRLRAELDALTAWQEERARREKQQAERSRSKAAKRFYPTQPKRASD